MTETYAKKTFLRNLARMESLVGVLKDTKKLEAEIQRQRGQQAAGKPVPTIDRLNKRLEKRQTNMVFLAEWQVAMFVTFAESYLQDALASAAGVDERLMKESQQAATYADLKAATSLNELAYDLRSRWAKGFIDNGGPVKWIERLEKMGARSFSPNLGTTMNQLWGVRHLIIHRAGIADLGFIKHHREFNLKPGDQIELTMAQIAAYSKAIREFVETTDLYFAKAYPNPNVV